ncbi:hypothetical protein M8C21_003446 [Ambrosia artemisiifolia]|uniref:Uncharacterized protein n=1 Tax=Ambrosia artemisiifolia TaxID=4212 RepID=A0AAD5BQI0_AMBAR|nr:hypothetical protein M8C21_003446 [Ambrosia artemisiifolia]
MLLAVEGGRFFSSSASGYSNGLSLLLLGQRKEETPMRVTPWNQYHLVDQGTDPNLQLAANKSRGACRCASLTCFGCASTGPESPSVGPTQNQLDDVKSSSYLEKVEENSQVSNVVEGDGGDTNGINTVSLKSSLKKRAATVTVSAAENTCDEVEPEPIYQSARRSVHWTDVTGGELCEIKEFEPSEHSDSDDEFENSTGKTCSCTIM